jgi:2-desacetyl-2-hydroxyethyl bacteriochlorophyllide A dehydrogenase
MKALFYTGTEAMEVRETADAQPGAGDVVLDVSFCGICGSDMHAYHGKDPRRVPPMILGHEAVGVARSGRHAGKRVAVNPLVSCGACAFCLAGRDNLCPARELLGMRLPGAYAEQVAVADGNLYSVADSLSSEDAALAEPLACAVHAVRLGKQLAGGPMEDLRTVVLGGGAIGVLSALVLAEQGARDLWIAEPNAGRGRVLEQALKAKVYDPKSAGPDATSADLIVDAVGAGATRKAASALAKPGSWIVHIGLQDDAPGLDTRRATLQEIGLIGTYCYTKADFASALRLLENGLIASHDWIEIRSLEDGPQAFADIHTGAAPPKIILATG